MNLVKRIKNYIENQYGMPTGFIGSYIGEKMVRQHKPETVWTIQLLDLKQNEFILELGCGAGFAMKLLLDRSEVIKIIGIDLSETVLKSASIRNRSSLKSGRANLVHANVNKLPFPDNHFTKLYSIHSIYFWDNIPESVAEISRVLKTDGKVVLTLCDGKDGVVWTSIRNMIQQQLIPEFTKAGFKNIGEIKGPDSRDYHTVAVIAEK
jgi:ubiquinone/menaquinone biosynthesis C-methylase UbiE